MPALMTYKKSASHAIGVTCSSLLLAALAACGPQNGSAPAAADAKAGTPVPLASANPGTTQLAAAPDDGVPPPPSATTALQRPIGAAVPPAPVVAATPAPARAPAPQAAAAVRPAPVALLGEVSSVEPIRERPPGTGKGAVIGGVLGGVVGNQFGHGNGRAAMTVLGAAGGAVAGNNVERNMNKRIIGWRVSVRMDNGTIRTFEEKSVDGLRAGDRVRIEGKHVRRA